MVDKTTGESIGGLWALPEGAIPVIKRNGAVAAKEKEEEEEDESEEDESEEDESDDDEL